MGKIYWRQFKNNLGKTNIYIYIYIFRNMIKYYKINCTHKNLDSFARKAFNLEIYPTIIIY